MRAPRTPRRGDKPRRGPPHSRRRLALALAAATALLLFACVSRFRDTVASAGDGVVVARRVLRPLKGGAQVEGEWCGQLVAAPYTLSSVSVRDTHPPTKHTNHTAVFRPGEPLLDAAGARLQAHGGWLLRAGGRWWWYGEDKEGPTYHNGK